MWYVKLGTWYHEPTMDETQKTRQGLAERERPGLHSRSVAALEGLGQALEALRRRRGWTAAEAARRTGIDQSNLLKYERNAKGITAATLDRILDGYGATLAELAATLREVQSGPAVRWIVPGEVSEADLKLVVKMVLGKKWAPDDEEDEEPEEETSDEDPPDGDRPSDGEDD